jgi:hypothetical protein
MRITASDVPRLVRRSIVRAEGSWRSTDGAAEAVSAHVPDDHSKTIDRDCNRTFTCLIQLTGWRWDFGGMDGSEKASTRDCSVHLVWGISIAEQWLEERVLRLLRALEV